ncbi:hypothetical protein RCL_jg16739.t1 [Rhizophagus clarus]|uniref:Uncharacterized protein n=1 Tax=Rhizophagus clarus TaxID=94130 RepID=A0A8H3LI74_9GLOM|nr:hypothetical protein RCL_jg16739.t1 [Rhizophagus clarus]
MISATLVHKDNEAYLISHNINMFKKVKLLDSKRKIIGYLSNWDDLYRLINTPNVWHDETVDWTCHTSPSHNPRKSTKRGAASQQQYSSSTKSGQDSPKADYDDKKPKSKSKRSSTSKKMIMAEITRMNEVLESLLKRTIT